MAERAAALRFIHSPDPAYREKWQRFLRAYQEALVRPDEVILLFQDEFTYHRHAEIRKILRTASVRQISAAAPVPKWISCVRLIRLRNCAQ